MEGGGGERLGFLGGGLGLPPAGQLRGDSFA